jgi:trk system potassium uptake protein
MNFRGLTFYLGLFCFPFSFLAFLNILYSSYFDYFLNVDSYIITLFTSLLLGSFFIFFGKDGDKKISFQEQLLLIISIYFISSVLVSIPYYLSNYQIPLINALFEAISGLTGTGFSIFDNIKYLDPTLIIWRSSSQWIGGLFFLIFLVLFFSNSKFNYKLNNLVFGSEKSLDIKSNIKSISLKIFFIYSFFTAIIFTLFSLSGVRFFNGLNLSMTIISVGGFLPTNSLAEILKNPTQEFILLFSFIISFLNIYFFLGLFNKKNIFIDHYEDIALILLFLTLSIGLLISTNYSFLDVFINTLSSLLTSGIVVNDTKSNFSLYFLFLTVVGGSLISNSSGIKFLRIHILLKATFNEIFKLVRPNNIINQNILSSKNKLNNEIIKLSFLIFISFFISLFILTSILLFDNISFEDSFKLSILTLTNTTNSDIYAISNIDFSNLFKSTKFFIILFMIIAKIELISALLLIKKIFLKN